MTSPDPVSAREPKDAVNGRLLFQAVRRHPVLFVGLILLTAGTGAGLWWALPLPRHTAAVVFQVAAQPPAILAPTSDSRVDFPAYRQTQGALVKKRQVLAAALESPEVRDLSDVREQADPVAWLDRRLVVDFRVGSEFMRVSAEGDDPEELMLLLRAVAKAYLTEVDEREHGQRRRRLSQLEEVQKGQRERLANVQKEIDAIAVKLGSKDAATLALSDQLAREELSNANRELAEIDAQLQILPAPGVAKPVGPVEPPMLMVEDRLRKDPTVIQLEGEVTKAKARLAATERSFKAGVSNPAITKAREEAEGAQDDVNRAKADLRPRVESALRDELTEERQRQAREAAETFARLTRRKDALVARTHEIRAKIADANHARIDLENLRLETTHADRFAGTIAEEAERLRLELGAPPRVTLAEEPYLAVGLEGNKRLKITLAGMLAVFVAGFGGLVLFEYKTRPVTRVRDATDALGLRLLGTVPAIGARAGRGGRYNADPHRALAEAIDTTRTLVLYGAADRRVRTLLVTSAVDGEGKTSLAGHLAISLARAGFRTLLVDGDVQAPSAHSLFNVPAAPGLCEVLRGDAATADTVHPSALPGLSVLPAGAWDLIARQSLAGNRWKALKADLEAEYDFVVVDSGPVLLVSDSLLMARDADGVLLSVLLDVSRVSSVEETRDRLRTVGANVLGVVVNGVVTPSYRSVPVRAPVVVNGELNGAGLPA
jgi:polysaccharide biosynthesis transport protein